MNDVFLKALRREPVPYTPVWLMRQAGRYLPEYNATRARAGSFMDLCRNAELACEVTLQPLERFPLDAAILFSDILTVPDAMGLGLSFAVGEGPRFARPVRSEADVRALGVPDPEDDLGYVMRAVRTIRAQLQGRVPLIGFSGSPWTLACYMIEGQGGTDFRQIKSMMYQRPDLLEQVLAVNTEAVTQYLRAQADSGAQVLMLFDSWGGVLTPSLFLRHSAAPMTRIVRALKASHPEHPVIVFTKGGGAWLEVLADTGADALGLDWTVEPREARRRVGARCALQGNLDPMTLMGTPERIRSEVQDTLERFGPGTPGHIFNLGHGISQFTPPDNVSVLVDAVHSMSRAARATP